MKLLDWFISFAILSSILFVIVMLISNFFGGDTITIDYDMPEYSCEELRDMIMLNIYPQDERLESVNFNYFGNITTTSNYESYDYKNYYKEKCMEIFT